MITRCVLILLAFMLSACSTNTNLDQNEVILGVTPPKHWQANVNESSVGTTSKITWGMSLPLEVQTHLKAIKESNLVVQIANLEAQQRQLDVTVATGNTLPSSKLTLTNSHNETLSSGTVEKVKLGLNISWEADLWSRLSDGVKQKQALYQASQYELLALQQSTQARYLLNWLDIIEQNKLLQLNRANIMNQQRRLAMSVNRLDSGLASSVDVRNAKTNLLRLKDSQRSIYHKFNNAKRSLNILIGEYPTADVDAPLDLPVIESKLQLNTPRSILLTRPDILEAEANLLAAGYAWERDKKNLLPKFTLNFNYNNEQTSLSDIFRVDHWLASISASLMQPIFYRDVLSSQAEKSHLQQQIMVKKYQNALLVAWQEVEAAAENERLITNRIASLKQALYQASQAEIQVETQYNSGLATSFELLSAQRTRTSVESDLVKLSVSQIRNRVRLQLALGLNE